MAHIQDVAAHILGRLGPMTAMKLQKLCYYSYGYHLAWEGLPMFPEHFEAWANGPVCPALYERHRGQFQVAADVIAGDADVLTEGEIESIGIVLDNLGHLSAHDLSTMTHREMPWIRARERAYVGPLERSTEKIDDGDIYEFFDALVGADEQEA